MLGPAINLSVHEWRFQAGCPIRACAVRRAAIPNRRGAKLVVAARTGSGLQSLVQQIAARGGGALINTSSVESIVSLPLHAAYSAAKHAVEGFTDSSYAQLAGLPGLLRLTLLRMVHPGADAPVPGLGRSAGH